MHEKNLVPPTSSPVKSSLKSSFLSKLKLKFFLLFLSYQLCIFYYIKNYSKGCVDDCKYCCPSRECGDVWAVVVQSWYILHQCGTEGMFPTQTLKAVQSCLGGKVLAFITLLLSGKRHQQHSWTTFCSWENLSVGPLVCFTESQGQASSSRLSNTQATLNSRLHHWGKQTLPASTVLVSVLPTRFAEQQFACDSICGVWQKQSSNSWWCFCTNSWKNLRASCADLAGIELIFFTVVWIFYFQ